MNQQEPNSETVEVKRKTVERCRVKPRHLSQIVRQAIIDQFQVRQSSEDIAEELGIPVGTVRDVLLLHQLRKPPASVAMPMLVRRTA